MALEELLATNPSLVLPIFEGGDDAMFGHVYYLGMLRALEVLAWDPGWLKRVSMLLAKLAAIDPGGRLSNRPISSLVQIFLPWNLHTNAPTVLRHRVLAKVCSTVPEIAWELISKLLPGDERVSFGTSEPAWRDLGASERIVTTYESMRRDHEYMIDLAAQHAGLDAARWASVIKAAIKCMPPGAAKNYLDLVEERQSEFIEAGVEQELWKQLRDFVDMHRSYADADWAAHEDALAPVERLVELLTPKEPLFLHQALFDQHMPDRRRLDETFESHQDRLLAERDAAIRDVVSEGVENLVNFAGRTKVPQTMLASIMRVCNEDQWREFSLLSFDKSSPVAWLGACVLANGVSSLGISWGLEVLQMAKEHGATAAQVVSLMMAWDDSRELLDLVQNLPEEGRSEYWRRRDVYVRTADDGLATDFIRELIRNGRSAPLIEFVGSRRKKADTELLLDLVAGALESLSVDSDNARLISGYWLREVFEELRGRDDADRQRLMQLEYSWLPVLHSYGETKELALHQYLAQSPSFFVEVLSDLYRKEPVAGVDEVEDVQVVMSEGELAIARAKAMSAYKLLDSWRFVPWVNSDGDIDEEALMKWINEVLERARDVKREKMAASEIGKLLAYAPEDREDGVWPCRQVRNVIEELESELIESSIVVELFNKRGAHMRPADGGGEPERELAAASAQSAKTVAAAWPRTARMLRENSERWLSHAEWHDRRSAEERISL
jgi:hypothetical protein